jgi:hypothetical protein
MSKKLEACLGKPDFWKKIAERSFAIDFIHPEDPKNPCFYAGHLRNSTKIAVHVGAHNLEEATAKAINTAPKCSICYRKYIPI